VAQEMYKTIRSKRMSENPTSFKENVIVELAEIEKCHGDSSKE